MKRLFMIIILLVGSFVILVGCKKEEFDEYGYYVEEYTDYESNQNDDAIIKNIILIIGDGMGENQVKVTEMFGLLEG